MSLTMTLPVHIPVLAEEVIEALRIQPGKRYIDCTLGSGGHAKAIMGKNFPDVQLLGIDTDMEALKTAKNRLADYSTSIMLINDNFINLEAICKENDFLPADGILFDLGISSLQIENAERGFSFQHDGPLDMRFSPTQELTAADIINTLPEDKLHQLIRIYGEEYHSRQIARHIINNRPISSTLELSKIVEHATGGRRGKIHPATKTFMALRIATNRELKNIAAVLEQAIRCLNHEGRLVVISYHSLEDRLVKQFMKHESQGCICPPEALTCHCGHTPILKLISKKVITPSREEMSSNPRSRSAKLRVAEYIAN